MEINSNMVNRNNVQMLISGFMSTAIIYVACELNLFDAIEAHEKVSVTALSEKLNVGGEYLLKILRPLDSYKLIRLSDDIQLTEQGKLLTDNHPESLKNYALFCGRESVKGWMELYPAIIQNKSPYDLLEHKGMFESLDSSTDRFFTFNGMMSSVSNQLNLTGVFEKLYSKNDCLQVVDVGGGTGTIIKKALTYYINSKGTIVDLPQAKNDAEERLAQSGLSKRCRFVEGDFFKPINEKGDIYILSRVLHDWDDEKSTLILQNVSAVMGCDSRLVVIDEVVLDCTNPNALKGYICDIQMWVFCNGKERTYQEFENLLEKADLEIESLVDIDNGTCGLICRKKNSTDADFVMGEI